MNGKTGSSSVIWAAGRVLLPFLAVGGAFVVRLLIGPLVGDVAPYTLFFLAVAVTALCSGAVPSLLAQLLSIPAVYLLLSQPFSSNDLAGVLLFSLAATSIAFLGHVAQRRRATGEEALRRYQVTFNHTGVGIVEAEDASDHLVAVNDRACAILGRSREELLSMNVHELTFPEDRLLSDRVNRQIHEGISDVVEYEKRYLRGDGTPVWANVTVTAVRDAEARWVRSVTTIQDISDLKRAEEERRVSEDRYRFLADVFAQVVWVVTPDGRFVEESPSWLAFTGQSKEQAAGFGWLDAIHPRDRQLAEATLRKACATKATCEVEYRLRNHEGEYRTTIARAAPVFDEQGEIREWVGMNIDVTEQRLSRAALLRTQEQLAKAEAFSLIMPLHVTLDGRWSKVTPLFVQFLGYENEEEILGREFREFTHPEDFDADWSQVQRLLVGEIKSFEMEKRFLRRDGSVTWGYLSCSVVTSEEGVPVHLLTYVRDMNVQKRAEEELRRSEATLNAVLDALPVGVVISDPDGQILQMNRKFEQLWETPPRHLTISRQQYGEWVAFWPESGERIRAEEWALSRTLTTDETVSGELVEIQTFETRQRRYLLNSTAPVIGMAGSIIAGVVAVLDVTERILAERSLRESELRLRTIFDSDLVGIMYWDMTGRITDANDKFLEVVGYTRGDLTERQLLWSDIASQESFFAGETPDRPIEREFTRKDGSRVPVIVGLAALTSDGDNGVAFVLDITDRKKMEREIEDARIAAERSNQAKDEFLAVLSHELRTPLTPVLAALSLMKRQGGLSAEALHHVEVIRRNVSVEARLIDDLLDLTRIVRGKVSLEKRFVSLSEILSHVADVCRPDLEARRIHFEVKLEDDRYLLFADTSRLQQVFWNIIKNSVKFTPEGGCVGVRAFSDGGRVVVEIFDSGIGIEPELLPKIFDAFEQGGSGVTRQFGGLGLGLAITKSLVEMHGGTISARSEGMNKGTVFEVVLPLAEEREVAATKRKGFSRVPEGEIQILLVEDHGDTARLTQALLESVGHKVEVAGDVAQALKVASEKPFDLLISDLGLPDRSGLELMRELKDSGKLLKGIALSGYGREDDVHRSKEAGFSEHLTKPVDFEILERAVLRVSSEPSLVV